MTTHTPAPAQQAVLTDDQIEALAKKHIAPHADRLDAIMQNPVPYQQTEQFRRVKALIADVLSKLRAPVADERAAQPSPAGNQYHLLKTDPEVFQAVLDGAKTFEIRLNDRGYAVGDVLGLCETKHTGAEMRAGAPLVYTGRECQRFVSHVLTGYGLAEGWCCLSFDLPHAGGASAPADPEAAEVDFMVRVLENLDIWRAEEWSDLLERRPAILALLRPMVMASAPVAGEANPVAWMRKTDITEWTDTEPETDGWTPLYDRAAPQASEAVRDAERLEFLITHGAWVAWSKDHELCRVFHRDEDGDIEPFLGWRESARAAAYTARDAIDAAMAALSAQPGAQKGCNCATCRPHSVEMRMILCETCGDKRCPHAADHRNACTGAHPDHKDGGAVYG